MKTNQQESLLLFTKMGFRLILKLLKASVYSEQSISIAKILSCMNTEEMRNSIVNLSCGMTFHIRYQGCFIAV